MSYDTELSQRKYHRLTDLASRWKLEVRELLRFALEGGIGVAIYEFRGADHHIDSIDDGEFPNWAVFIPPDVLKNIVSAGEAYVSGGFRFTESEATATPVYFPERLLTAEDLIVLPKAFAELANLVSVEASSVEQDEPEMSPASRSTLLKQIAMLAVLLSKQQPSLAWGERPNGSKIALEIDQAIANWPVESMVTVKRDFFSSSAINASIQEGLDLIGFNKASGDK